MKQIYLDYNATTPIEREVFDGMVPFLTDHFGNPSSSHYLGRICREAIERARGQVAALIGAEPDEIYFTSGGTEANNLAIKGVFFQPENRDGRLVTSCFEHPAVKVPAQFHHQCGGKVTFVKCDSSGTIDPETVEAAIDQETRLVSIMHANNEIGSVQPISEISSICRERGVLFHTDAAQSVGKYRANVDELGVDFLTIAGHKLYAPKGVGALYIRNGVKIVPAVHGASHERGLRPGTENVAYIVGLGIAASLAMRQETRAAERMRRQRNRLEEILRQEIGDRLMINGINSQRLPNTSSLVFPDVIAESMLRKIPEICVSTGAACHSDSISLSDTLSAIGLNDQQGAGTVRISLGRNTTDEEIESAANLLLTAWEQVRST